MKTIRAGVSQDFDDICSLEKAQTRGQVILVP